MEYVFGKIEINVKGEKGYIKAYGWFGDFLSKNESILQRSEGVSQFFQ